MDVEILESLKRVFGHFGHPKRATQDFRVPKKEVKPMEQIRTIYREVFSKSPAAIGADQKLTEEIEQEIEESKKKSRASPHRGRMDRSGICRQQLRADTRI